jgi:DnaJ-class molecular chaperone
VEVRIQLTPEDQLKKYLDSQASSSLNDRKVIFKDLMLKYHPDKNQDKAAEATEMFQFLQRQKTWFLREDK